MASRKQRQIALLKVLAAAAWADGRLDNEEINRIKDLILAYDLEPAETREVQELLEAPVSYARCEELTRELMNLLGTQGERREALEEVETVFRADGEMSEDEREVLEGLKGIMEAMDSVDRFMGRITGVFRRMFAARDASRSPGQLTEFLKNSVLQRLDDLSGGAWREDVDAATLNRYTLFGAVLGRVADAEGGISDEESARIRDLLAGRFELRPPLLDWVVQSVREASTAGMDRQALLSEYNRIADMDQRKRLLRAAFAVAAADGTVSREELEELQLISNFLWIDRRELADIRREFAAAEG